jgi:hypothetical protein
VLAGQVPYRDFSLEYPPGALPAFVLPSLGPAADYRAGFEALMLACGAGVVVLVGRTLFRLGASTLRLYLGTALPAVATGLLGSVVLTRFDYWPALLTVAAVAGVVAGRDSLGLAALGAGIATKLYPAVLLPVLLVEVWRRRGRRAALRALAASGLVVGALFVPFALLSPHGFAHSFGEQAGRPLQIESAGSALLLVAHELGAYDPVVVSSYGSQNLTGAAAGTLTTLSVALQIVAVVGCWVLFASGQGARRDPLAACALAVAAFVAFGKVLSPQYLIWLVPLVALVPGRAGAVAGLLFFGCCALTQLWFPTRYWDLVGLEGAPIAMLAARDALLVVLAGVLWAATGPARARSRSA